MYTHPGNVLIHDINDYNYAYNQNPGIRALADVDIVGGTAAALEDALTDWCGGMEGFGGPQAPSDFLIYRWAAIAAVIGDFVGPYPIAGEGS